MVDPTALLVMGLSRQQLTAIAGVAGGVAVTLSVVAMLVFSVLPAYSQRWTDRLGATAPGRGGPDPAEVISGREQPIAAPSPRGAPEPDAPSAIEDGSAGDEDRPAEPEDAPVADGGDATA